MDLEVGDLVGETGVRGAVRLAEGISCETLDLAPYLAGDVTTDAPLHGPRSENAL